jgi:hypothetical protein
MFITNKKHMVSILLGAATLACSSAALASFLAAEKIADKDDGVFHVGIEGNYLWQSGNTAEINSVGGAENPSFSFAALPLINKTPAASWGGGIDIAYLLPSHRYDISASYYFLRSDKSESSSVPLTSIPTTYLPVNSDFDYDFDSADILLGTYFKPTKRWLMRVGYGLGFARIDQQSNGTFNTAAAAFPADVNPTKSTNSFLGLGPKVTVGGDFKLLSHVYVISELGLSVLYGKSKAELDIGEAKINGIITQRPVKYQEDNYQGALGFEGKLGLAYVKPIKKEMAFSLEAGFKGQSYVNALQDESLVFSTQNNTTVTTDIDFDGTYSNFGPYIDLSLDFS